ncbi:MAG TPA: hypothetical protein VFC10_16440 [Terriglobia bacterium]|jgi:hypothetical protein|nr:hypothetical protein [Terriglobia bacterium]
MTGESWRNFFSGIFVDFWEEAFDESHTKAEVDFIQGELNIPPGAAILDVPCGKGRLNTDYIIVRNGQGETNSGSHRIYTYRELVHLLRSVGFGDIESFGSLAQDPFTISSIQLILVAKVAGWQNNELRSEA